MIEISVIIPTYKPNDDFKYCIESLEKQTLDKSLFEVIIVLNGDKEPYQQFITKIIEKSELNICCFFNPDKGVSNARNYGIDKAIGKYITFLDSDDWFSESYLSSLYFDTENKKSMVVSDVICFNPETNSYSRDFLGDLFKNLKKDRSYSHLKTKSYFSVPWAKLLPADICKKNKFNNEFSYGEDALFMFTIEPYLKKVFKSNENSIYYRRFCPDSLSNQKRSEKEIRCIHIKLLKEYWRIYLRNITKYNFGFFINRNLAIIKHILFSY